MHIIPLIAVALTSLLVILALKIKKCIYSSTEEDSSYNVLYYVVWILTFVSLGIAGQKIWSVRNEYVVPGMYPYSIGRRISFFILLTLILLWPLLHWHWCLPAFSMLVILIAILLSVGLMVVMIPKDPIASILLIPLTIGLIYTAINTRNSVRI
jgi:tryptophan-rich sensory protein